MISIGTIGLIKAVNTFVPARNIKLATYASRCIENEILMYLRKSSNRRQEASIDEPLNTDGDGNELLLSDVLGSDQNQVGYEMEQDVERTMLHQAIDTLDGREKTIMQMRFGLGGRGGAHPEGGGRRHRHLPELHLPAGKENHPPTSQGAGKDGMKSSPAGAGLQSGQGSGGHRVGLPDKIIHKAGGQPHLVVLKIQRVVKAALAPQSQG